MMIVVEEQCFKSVKTDASLYNGQPTDTGVKCHLADQQRVIVELFCSCLVATAYIPKEAMMKISLITRSDGFLHEV